MSYNLTDMAPPKSLPRVTEVSCARCPAIGRIAITLALGAVVITTGAQEATDNTETQRQLTLLDWTKQDSLEVAPLSQFVRVVSTWSDADRTMLTVALQTSVRCLRKPGTDDRIALLSMHHYGEAAYYRALAHFCTGDNTVLYEGYDPDETARGELCDMLTLVAHYQRGVTRRLNLVHQNTWKKTVMNAWWQELDMPLREVNEACAKLPASAVNAQRKLVAFVESDVTDAGLYEHVLTNAAEAVRIKNPLEELDHARERVIFDGLKVAIERGVSRRIVLMYGALHTAALERRIVAELGYRLEWSLWNDVLRYSRKP